MFTIIKPQRILSWSLLIIVHYVELYFLIGKATNRKTIVAKIASDIEPYMDLRT